MTGVMTPSRVPPACRDGLDNDADGTRDGDDPDCVSDSGIDEGNHALDPDGDSLPFYVDNCTSAWNPDQGDSDGDLLGDAYDPFPENSVNPFGQCLLDVGDCRQELSSCTSDQQVCTADLGTCKSDLISASIHLDEALAELEACRQAPPPDADEDGETDSTDACPDTAPGEDVDQAGCSRAQFCRGVAIDRRFAGAVCRASDWKNDHPIRRPGDCRLARRGWVPFVARRCESARR